MTDVVEVKDTGMITTFCVVNIPFEGQELDPPYVAASVVLDGADTPLFHLIGNTDRHEGADGDARPRRVARGRGPGTDPRVHPILRADGRARRRLRNLQGPSLSMRDVAIIASAQVPNLRSGANRDDVEMVQKVVQGALGQRRLDPRRRRILLLWQRRLP